MSAQATPSGDPAHDVLRSGRRPLDAIFAPHNVAVIGATEEIKSVGRTLVRNLISNPSSGAVFPVNPGRNSVLGIKAYPNVREIPEPVDLAIVATPAPTVPGVIRECAEVGIPGAVVISAGFKETGAEGVELEKRVLAEARRGRMRVLGPNCLGVMRPASGFNATFASAMVRPGNVGFVSQSGALGTAILDWSLRENVGFSAFVSIGSMMDVGWGDLIYYLGDDPYTKSIVIYMESIGDAKSFLSAAREVSLAKPIVVLKAGHTEAAATAAASHTGTLTGSDEVLDAAFRRCGVLRVGSIADLFDMAEALAKQPRPKGNRLAIVTNAGGPAVLATDSLVEGGGELAQLSDETLGALDEVLPAYWSHGNPVDTLGDADPDRFARTVEIIAADPGSDGLLAILTPQAMTDPTRTAERLRCYKPVCKPLLASWMGGAEVAVGESVLNGAGIPTFEYPDTAGRVFNYMWCYNHNLNALYETPVLPTDYDEGYPAREQVESIVRDARERKRNILTEPESKQLLAAYGIPTVETRVAGDEDQAVRAAEELGYPVVVKLLSGTITHKTDVGGVYLDLKNAGEVRRAYGEIESSMRENYEPEDFEGVSVQPMVSLEGYEIIVGSSLDPQFGPVLLFGSGGSLVEVYRDRALTLPPLTTTLARRMMERTRIHEALKGIRGREPVDTAFLEKLLVRFSHLVVEQPWIREIDINPLLVSPERLVALDARVVLHGAETGEEGLSHPAIRPYPTRYVADWQMENGDTATIRPIRPEDEPLMVGFHQTLSDHSVYMRYLHSISLSRRASHERLLRLCFIDFDREMALVAERKDPATGAREIMGVARLSKLYGTREAECAVLVGDRFQRLGLGTELLRRLIRIGREEKLQRIVADILYENYAMQRICKNLGFDTKHVLEEGVVKATLEL